MLSINNLPNLPHEPGCYLYKDKNSKVIYVGKAKYLNKRVKSYFQKIDHDPKTKVMIEQVKSIDFIVTRTEKEALILENNLIKKHYPKYNVNLKDSKRYAYIMLTKEDFPRLLIARKKDEFEARYFGPFTSAEKRDYIIETLKRAFKLRTCKRLPKKTCLRFHLGLCDAPCINKITKDEYFQNKTKPIESVLRGNIEEIIKRLKNEMTLESSKKNYERALELRNQVEALDWLKDKQTVQRSKIYDEDIIHYKIKDNRVYLILFNINKGILENKQEFDFEETANFLEEFIIQYYSENSVPKEIILPVMIDKPLHSFLEEKRGNRVIITIPEKGEKKLLLDLVMKNIDISFFGEIEKLEKLKEVLNLQEYPRVIECFDVSHLRGTAMVGSMVQFRNGKPDKTNYRRFKIKTVDQIDDFASIKEIITRRYYRLKIEKQNFPDLIIIDGGKGQLNSSIEGLNALGIKIPIISIAKEFEEIYTPESFEPIRLDRKNKALLIIQSIRDEAHRFAIHYNRLLRSKKMFE